MNSSQEQYFEAIDGLDQYGILLCGLIKELLFEEKIQIHSISYRIKDYESCIRKLTLKPERYQSIQELMDLLGVRIITYFPDDVDKVARVIKREFEIDQENSIDKRKSLRPNQFGYLSLHFITSLSKQREKLIEYRRHKRKRFELQIRTILQHAWAEIEHDLGYKAYSSIPETVKRRFFRLAGSLELADEEFERLREEILKYEKDVSRVIKSKPESLLIDQSTLISSLKHEEPLNRLDRLVAEAGNRPLNGKIKLDYVGREAEQIKALGINNVELLHKYAQSYAEHVSLFAKKWLNREPANSKFLDKPPFNRGIGLFYLGYTLAAQQNDTDLKNWGLRFHGRRNEILKEVRLVWDQVVNEIGEPPKLSS